jgi:uncharacterized damage-inducible protein DinB
MNPIRIYDYLTQARERLFDTVRSLSPEQYNHEFTFGLKTLGSTLTHTMIVEWSYMERIRGHALPPYEKWPIQDEHPPAFEVIEKTWREQTVQTRATLAAIQEWDKEFSYISLRPIPVGETKPKKFRMTVTPGDVVTQMFLHEVHHRAQVMMMLRELGKPIENLDYAYFAYKREEIA